MRNRRKEFVIFGAIIAVIVIFLLVKAFGGRSNPYNRDDIKFDFSPTVAEENNGDNTEPTNEELVGDSSYEEPLGDSGEESASQGGNSSPQEGSDAEQNEGIDGDGVDVDGEIQDTDGEEQSAPPFYEEPVETDINYANILATSICGRDDGVFDSHFTSEFREFLNTCASEEPYKSLNGNTLFKDTETDGNRISFGAADGNRYTFEFTLEDGKVSSIVYIP